MNKTAEQMFQSMNGGKHSKTSIEHGETFTAAFVIQCMEEYASQQPVPQHTGGYSLRELSKHMTDFALTKTLSAKNSEVFNAMTETLDGLKDYLSSLQPAPTGKVDGQVKM